MHHKFCFAAVFVILLLNTSSLFVRNLWALKAPPTVNPISTPISTTVNSASVRTDGLYFADIGGNPKSPAYQYFRFFDDGTGIVLKSVTTGTPVQVSRWFSKDSDSALEGSYKLVNGTLTLIIGSERGANTKYSGPLLADYWILNPESPKPIKFIFARVVFPKAVASPGQNRAPKIAPVVSTMDTFDYDEAGRTIGVTTTIEIKASDLDGDKLTFVWTADAGNVNGNGPKCDWKRPLVAGQASGGTVVVTVTDGRGGKVSREFRY